MEYRSPTICPVCSSELRITKLACPKCGTELNGNFMPCKYCMLDEKQRHFMEAFLKSRGNIKEVERMLSISYPTVKGLLDDLLNTLFPEESTAQPDALTVSDVLDKLENKELTASEAAKLLEKLKAE